MWLKHLIKRRKLWNLCSPSRQGRREGEFPRMLISDESGGTPTHLHFEPRWLRNGSQNDFTFWKIYVIIRFTSHFSFCILGCVFMLFVCICGRPSSFYNEENGFSFCTGGNDCCFYRKEKSLWNSITKDTYFMFL